MSNDDYEVGYGKPPKHTQFTKNRSGNPKGRPKGSRNFGTDVKRTLKAPVRLTEGGSPKTVSTQEAALLRLREKALKGEIKNFTGISDPYEEPLKPEVTLNSEKDTEEESLSQLVAKMEELGYL